MGKSESKTLNYYDGISKGYESLYHDEQKLKIKLVEKYLPLRGRLLDLGSGDGVLNSFVCDDADLVSFDLSFELLKLNPNLFRVCGSILSLPFVNNSFDFVCSFSVFQDLSDIGKGVREVKRILHNGGVGIISFLKVSSQYEELCFLIKENFEVIEKIDSDVKDVIFVFKIKK